MRRRPDHCHRLGCFDPIRLGIALAVTLRAQYRGDWEPDGFLKLLADRKAHDALLAGRDVAAIMETWESELAEFRNVRARYLLYQ